MANNTTMYYIEHEDTIFELNATETTDVSYSVNIPQHPLLKPEVVSDNSVLQQPKFSIRGVLSAILNGSQAAKTGDSLKDIKAYIGSLKQIMEDKSLVTLYLANNDVFENCVITAFNYSQNRNVGLYGYKVNLTLTQIQLGELANITDEFVDVDADVSAEEGAAGSENKDEPDIIPINNIGSTGLTGGGDATPASVFGGQ